MGKKTGTPPGTVHPSRILFVGIALPNGARMPRCSAQERHHAIVGGVRMVTPPYLGSAFPYAADADPWRAVRNTPHTVSTWKAKAPNEDWGVGIRRE